MFSKRALLTNIKDTDDPIDVYSSGGAIHCDTNGTIENIGDVYLHKNGLANNLSYAKVWDKHQITYNGIGEFFTVHNPYKRIYFMKSKRGMYYQNCNPNGKKGKVTFVQTVKNNYKGLTKQDIKDTEEAQSAYNMVVQPSVADFERMVRVNILSPLPPLLLQILKMIICFVHNVGSLRSKAVRHWTDTVVSNYVTIPGKIK